MGVTQHTRRVWEYEPGYDEHPEIKAEHDEHCDEWFKLIPEETDEELEQRLTKSQRELVLNAINGVRRQLDGLVDQLDIFNLKGLRIIMENLDSISTRMFSVALDKKE